MHTGHCSIEYPPKRKPSLLKRAADAFYAACVLISIASILVFGVTS